jgi:membrane protease YdiL (CAAX protease family)
VISVVPLPDVPPPPPGLLRPGPPLDAAPEQARTPGLGQLSAPGLGLALTALALYIAGQLLAGIAGALFLVDGAEVPSGLLVLLAVLGQLLGLALVALLLRVRHIPFGPVLGRTRPMARLVLLGLGVGVGSVIANAMLGALLILITGTEAQPEQLLFDDALAGGLRTVLAGVAAVLLAPVAEELLFRGLLYRALRRRRSVAAAAILSSLAFAVIHADVAASAPLALLNLALLGALWAVIYERTGSLIVPIVAHAVFNLLTLLQVLLLARLGLLGTAPAVAALVPSLVSW